MAVGLLVRLEYLEGAIPRLRGSIAVALEPLAEQVESLQEIPGVNREAAEMVLTVVGVDMAPFAMVGHLVSWVGVCPGHHECASKRKTGRTP